MAQKKDYLKEVIKHIDIKEHNVVPLVEAMEHMAFSARDLNRAAKIYDMMLRDTNCGIILTLAGSIFSAGLKKVVYDMIMNNMVDAIVSTGAIIVDQDFFEALGFKHYKGTKFVDDNELRDLHIDRIYDTYIDEDELRTGMRKPGLFTGLNALLTIPVGGLHTVFFTSILAAYTFTSGAEMQNDQAVLGIRIGTALIPFVSVLLGIIPMFLSPITQAKEQELSEFSEKQHRDKADLVAV